MDEVELRYGSGSLRLTKSAKLIGLKPSPGRERQMLAAAATATANASAQPYTLGGFHIVNVEQAPKPMEETLDELRENAVVAAGTHVFHTSDDEVPFVPTGNLYVVFKDDAPNEEVQQLLDRYGLQLLEARDRRKLIVQITPQADNPVKTAAALQQSPLVEVAEPELATPGKLQAFVLPNDALLVRQWHLRNTGFHRGTNIGFLEGADARVLAAWNEAQSIGAPVAVVAIIDDGFDLSHPDLSGNGKVVAPHDFTRDNDDPSPDFTNQDWHGTACAGVAVGNANGIGIVGAAPLSRLMPVRWGRELSDKMIENWFDYVRQQGAWVVSCSWSAAAGLYQLSARQAAAIALCAHEGRNGKGCVVCFAAGNEHRDINDPAAGSVNGFATHPDVIAVAACNSRDQHSSYSNFGKEISVCAPSSGAGGWGITTSDVTGEFIFNGQRVEAGYSPGPYTDDFGGTSSATPLVAGICALLLALRPEMAAGDVRALLERTARRIGPASAYDEHGHSAEFGFGCVDAQSAVRALLG
jgi:subtilisin family serine protease